MSSFYDDASWLLIPSGIKEDVVYAQKPTSGLGDLTFTRASDATYTDSTGVVRRSPYNLASWSEMFSDASWSKTGITVTPNVALAPNGTMTADRIQFSSSNRALTQTTSLGTGVVCTSSFYVLGTAGETLLFAAGGLDQLVTLTGSWQRISTTKTSINSTINVSTFGGATARDIFLWGAQLVEGTSALDYFPTTNRQDVPRIDFRNADGTLSSCGRLLLEPQRTNIALQSETFSNATWAKSNATISADVTTAPNGTNTADKLVDNSVNDQHRIDQTSASVIGTNVFSVYAKKAERSFVQLRIGLSGAYFDLNTGATGGISAGITASIQDAGNGWYRCVIVRTSTVANEVLRINLATAFNTNNFIGDGTSGAFIWGAQLEAGAYQTTYIPTTTAAVTRIADTASKTGVSSLIGQTEGTLFAEVNWGVKPESGSPVISILTLNNNVTNAQNAIILGIERASGGTNRVYCLVQVSNVTQAGLFGSSITSGNYKIALAYKQNDFVLYVNGVQIASDTSGNVPTTSQILLGQKFNGESFVMADEIAQAALFPTRLDNATLAQLTTL